MVEVQVNGKIAGSGRKAADIVAVIPPEAQHTPLARLLSALAFANWRDGTGTETCIISPATSVWTIDKIAAAADAVRGR